MGIFSLLKKGIKGHSEQKSVSKPSHNDIKHLLIDILELFSMLKIPIYRSHVIYYLLGDKKKTTINETALFSKYNNLDYTTINKAVLLLISKRIIEPVSVNNHIKLIKNDKHDVIDINTLNKNYQSFQIPKKLNEYLKTFIKETNKKPVESTIKNIPKINLDEISGDNLEKALTEYRALVAKTLKIAPFLVFQNQTLKNIVLTKPVTLESLKNIEGIGINKANQYGEDIIKLVNRYHNKKDFDKRLKFESFEKLFDHQEFVSKKDIIYFYKKYENKEVNVSKEHLNHVQSFKALEQYRDNYNENWVNTQLNEKEIYLDNILKNVDAKINLDEKQRRVVLRDEDYTLVVAGAGAGKTTTVAAKVKYLIDKKHVDPGKILIVSYTNDAVNELKTKINFELDIPAIITTFHKVGYAIVKKHREMDKSRVISEGRVFYLIRDYLHNYFVNNDELLKTLVLFFGYYIDYDMAKSSIESFKKNHGRNDYTTLKTNIEEINDAYINTQKKHKKSIKNEVLRSIEEVQIANFLFLHQVEYQYEAAYPFFIEDYNQLYTPDFTITQNGQTIYLEHFGITESKKHDRYSDEEIEKYLKSIQDKMNLHKEKGTHLIYTFSEYNDNRPMLEHLEEELEKAGIVLKERSFKDVFFELKKDEDNKYLNKFTFLIKDFIQSFKINGYTERDFKTLYEKTENVRNRMFLKLSKPIYLHYQQILEENSLVDFEDMINESTQIIKDSPKIDTIPDFDYIIVDEYQDISLQRFDLTKELSKLTDAKIMAVGDDWQSIFAFAGSRIDLFINFRESMGYAEYLDIDYTYRNGQEVIDIAGNFIQKNNKQLKKRLKSPKTINKPIVLYEYSDIVHKNEKKGYKGIIHEKAKICDGIIDKIVQVHGTHTSIALLARYNFEYKHFAESEFFQGVENDKGKKITSIKHPNVKLIFMTIHASKGLGFDNVIILNGSDENFGFPSKLEMDPLLRLVKYDDRSYSYAEERRLFYVALTRTKNRVFILYPSSKPSIFVKELADEYNLVLNKGKIVKNIPLQDRAEKICPICGYPLQFKHNSAYGLKLFMCTNEPELCDYMTNNLRSSKTSIHRCNQCKDGIMIVKHSKKTNDYFFGCTNYKQNRKGCNNIQKIPE